MSKRTRWALVGAAVALVLLIFALSTSDSGLAVETARVERGPLATTVVEEGRTRVRERYVVAAPVSGRLARIAVEAGDAVSEGTPLARLFPMPEDPRSLGVTRARVAAAEARRREAEARLEEAETRVAQLERDVARTDVLVADSILSSQEGEQARLALATARQQVRAVRAAVRAAEADLAAARAALTGASPQAGGPAVPVTAPTAGRVLRVLEESERVVPAGTPLVEIGDAGGLEVVVDVLSEDAVRIAPGAPVRIEEWGGDRALRGTVRLVEPDAFTEVSALGVEEQRVNVIADLADPPPSLGSGYRVEAHIVTWQGDSVLRVPTSALFQRDGAWHVFTIEGGEAALRAVEIGHRATEAAEVLGGLDEGDAVILFPSDQVEAGVRVR
jgi:HlyD family secretion protein